MDQESAPRSAIGINPAPTSIVSRAGPTKLGINLTTWNDRAWRLFTPAHSIREAVEGHFRSGPEELRYAAYISVWLRWFILTATIIELVYRPRFTVETYIPYIAMAALALTLNGAFHYRLLTKRPVGWRWFLATSVLDATIISGAIAAGGGFAASFFPLYYPALVMGAFLMASLALCLTWTTIVAASYVGLSLGVGSGVDYAAADEKDLFMRVVVMYAVVIAVNLVTGFERIGRRQAVDRERALQRERIDLSQTIHDTSAQSAYIIGLGIDNAIGLAGDSNAELSRTLAATSELSKSAMWELRRPIDMGGIYEGQPLAHVLNAHARTFTTITSVPAELVQSGTEPALEAQMKAGVLSIAHNALTNAHRHARASSVRIELEFRSEELRLSVIDDGVGLPEDYRERGHGFRNMQAEIERLGGASTVESGGPGEGTNVTCRIPYAPNRRGD